MRTDVKISGIGVLWAAVGGILLIWLWKPAPPLADEIYLAGIIAINLVAFVIGVRDQRVRRRFGREN